MSVSDYIIYTNHFDRPGLKNKNLYGPPHLCMGFNYLNARATSRRQFTLTTKFPEILGTHFIDLGRMRG